MDVPAVLAAFADGVLDLREVLLVVICYQGVVVVVEAVLYLLGGICHMDDSRILIRGVELHLMLVSKRMCVFQISRMADMYRIRIAIYRVGRQVEPVVLLTEALLRVLQTLLAIAYRVVVAGEVAILAAPEDGVAQRNMTLGGIHGQSIGIEHGPANDTVACIGFVVVDILAMLGIPPRADVHHGVVVDTRCFDHRVLRPEELYRVAFAEVIRRILRLRLTWTNDDVVEVLVVAVPNNGIVGVFYTFPLAAPYISVLAALAVLEPWIDCITQHYRMYRYLVFASEGRVVLSKGRCDIQYQVDGRVASACCGVGVRLRTVTCIRPDGIRILTTQDIRQIRFADRVRDRDVVGLAYLDIYVEYRVARILGVVRRYGYAVDEGGVLHECLVAPSHSGYITTLQVDGRIVG